MAVSIVTRQNRAPGDSPRVGTPNVAHPLMRDAWGIWPIALERGVPAARGDVIAENYAPKYPQKPMVVRDGNTSPPTAETGTNQFTGVDYRPLNTAGNGLTCWNGNGQGNDDFLVPDQSWGGLSIWVNVQDIQTRENIFAQDDTFTNSGGRWLLYAESDNTFRLGVARWTSAITSSPFSRGEWYHILCNYYRDDAGNNQAEMYLNGQLDVPLTSTGILIYPEAAINVTVSNNLFGRQLDGAVALPKMWGRRITPSEALEDYLNPYWHVYEQRRTYFFTGPTETRLAPDALQIGTDFTEPGIVIEPEDVVGPFDLQSGAQLSDADLTVEAEPELTIAELAGGTQLDESSLVVEQPDTLIIADIEIGTELSDVTIVVEPELVLDIAPIQIGSQLEDATGELGDLITPDGLTLGTQLSDAVIPVTDLFPQALKLGSSLSTAVVFVEGITVDGELLEVVADDKTVIVSANRRRRTIL